jgi:alpha-tubulin suppressor-like RCC1 family protein
MVLVCVGAFVPAVARAEEPVSHLSLLAGYGKDIGKQKLFSSTNGDRFDWRKAPSVNTLNDDLIFVPTERGLQVEVTPTVEKWWRLTMVPPEGTRFAPGHYPRVQSRFNNSPDVAWFHIASAESCEAPGGHLDVLQAEYGPDGMPTVFAATFVQVCAGQALTGAISLGLPDPPALPSFAPEPATLTINVPPGTSLSPAGSYTFSTLAGDRVYRELHAGGVTVSTHGEWNVKLTSPDLKMAGTQPATRPKVEMRRAGHLCNNQSQPEITVNEFLRGPNDDFRETVVRLVTDFELLCDGVLVRGNITIGKPNPTIPDLNTGGAGHPPSSLVMYGNGFITKGQALDFSTQRLDNLRWMTDGNRVFTYVRGAGGVTYALNFAAPKGETLRPGRYLRASRYPFNAPGSPGMDVSGDGRGCGSYQGFFEVTQADFTAEGKLEHFVATFEFHCESTLGDVLRGEIRLGVAGQPAMPTLPTEQPKASLTVTRGWGRDFGTETRLLTTSNGWDFVVETFEPVARPGYLYVNTSSPGLEPVGFVMTRPDFNSRIGPLTAGDFGASTAPDVTNMSFNLLGWGGTGCSDGTGSVRVREAEYGRTDSFPRALQRFRADFQIECALDGTFRGEFTYELPDSTPQHGEPTGWGYNGFGEVGPKATDVQAAASPVDGIGPIKEVSAGYLHSLALKEDGTVWAWGWNGLGQLGDGSVADRRTPVQVKGLTDIVSISAGAFHSLAVRRDGTLWAWGWNAFGQLGTGTTLDHVKPVQIPGMRVTDASAGYLHSLAVGTDKNVWSWGWNGFGQLGDGTLTDRRSPVRTSGVTNSIGVSAGWFHSLAINNGHVAAWGWNGLGQLGTGDTVDRLLPVRPPELTQVHTETISAGFGHSLSRSFHGNSTHAWGWNAFGQLGDGTTVDRSTPVRIALPGGIKFRRISAGLLSSVADGSSRAYAWGYNGLGQVGDTTTTDRLVPTLVPDTLGVFDVSAGGLHTLVAGFKTGWQAPSG